MTDLDALRRAVLDRPDDDTPRGVFADCLDDLGAHHHAAYIRGQIEYARRFTGPAQGCPTPITFTTTIDLPGGAFEVPAEPPTLLACNSCCCDPCRERGELELLIANLGTRGEFDFLAVPEGWGQATWRRGFVERLDHITAAGWREQAAQILAAHPVRRVNLTTQPDPADQLHHRVSRMEGDLAVDQWNESPLWPGVKFDLPRRTPTELWEALRVDAAARSYAANREVMGRFLGAMPRLDPALFVVEMGRVVEAFRTFATAAAEAVRPAVAALTPIARAMAAVNLQPVHVSRKDRRRRRK